MPNTPQEPGFPLQFLNKRVLNFMINVCNAMLIIQSGSLREIFVYIYQYIYKCGVRDGKYNSKED